MENPELERRSLTAALRAIAVEDANLGASPAVEVRLLSEVRALHHVNRGPTPVLFYALAASLFLALSVPVRYVAQRAPSPGATPGSALPNEAAPATLTRESRNEVATPFYPLAFGNVPMTDGQLVRLDVSREALMALGLEARDSVDATSSKVVRAEVLIGEDGLARAVRFVRLESRP